MRKTIKTKKRPYRALAAYVLLALVSLLGVGGLVRAYSGGGQQVKTVIEHVENYYEAQPAELASVGMMIGASANRPIELIWDLVNGLFVKGQETFDAGGHLTLTNRHVNAASSTLTDTLTVAGEAQFAARVVQGGTVLSTSTASQAQTFTAAQLCDNSVINLTSNSSTQIHRGTVWTTAGTSTWFSDCLNANGKYHDVMFINGSSMTSSQLAAGTGVTFYTGSASSTLVTSSLPLIAANEEADVAVIVRFIRDSATTIKAIFY